jgi:hypothetical protein
MSEPFLERLSRFTPDTGGLNRDALLFAAGRGSARPNRGWITLAAVLASTQALSLALLWTHSLLPAAGSTGPIATVPAPATAVEPPSAEAQANAGLWSVRHELLESETEDRPDEAVTLIETGPPLRAFAPPPPSILN